MSLDFRDLDLDWLADELDNRDESLEEPCQGGYDPDSPDRQTVIHDRRAEFLLDGEWGAKMNALDNLDLDTAMIDIKECWCFHECCRLIDQLDMTEIKAKKITIMGIYNEVKVSIVQEKFPSGLQTKVKDGVDYTLVIEYEQGKEPH